MENVNLKSKNRNELLKPLGEVKGQVGRPDGAAARLGRKRTTLQSRMRKNNIHASFARQNGPRRAGIKQYMQQLMRTINRWENMPAKDLRGNQKSGIFDCKWSDLLKMAGLALRPLQERIQTEQSLQRAEQTRLITKDGQVRWSADAPGKSEDLLRTIVEMAPDGIFIADDHGRFLVVNEAACSLLGYERETMLESRVLDIVAPHMIGHMQPSLNIGMGISMLPSVFLRANGTEVPVEVSLRKAQFRGHSAYVGIVRDVSDRKRAEEERAQLEDQLRQAQKLESLGSLAGGVAHDFNNQLTVINGFCDLILSSLKGCDPQRVRLEEIRKAGDRAATLTQQLLAFSRKQIIQPKPLDLNAEIRDTHALLQRLVGEDITFVMELSPSVGSVLADQGQVNQVLMNLVVNARDAMPGGGRLAIETRDIELGADFAAARAGFQEGSYVLLTVSDSGHGMDEDTLSHIFEPFFTTKPQGRGTGLGLSTVYGIVRHYGGWIDVESAQNEGTTFRVYLPRIESASSQASNHRKTFIGNGGSETVLVVEDEHAVRRLITEVLTEFGYRVLAASNGDEALQLAHDYTGPIHLVVTDVIMPGMTGHDVARRLSILREGVRVLFVSGYNDDLTGHRRIVDPGSAFLSKPVTPDALAAKVREVLMGPPLGNLCSMKAA